MDENQLKQRIVGAIVLVALAVIFIPMLLSGDRDGNMSIIETNIPPKPDNVDRVRTLEIAPERPIPDAEQIRRVPVDEHTAEDDNVAAPDVDNEIKAQATTPADDTLTDTNSSADKKAWAVQVGSFSKQSNALGLRDKLRNSGYSAFVEKVETDKGNVVYRVRVGPEVRRSKAEALQQELQNKLKLDGLVVAHP